MKTKVGHLWGKIRIPFWILVALILIGYYRAYVDQISFIQAFDQTAKLIVENGWNLLSNTTIFIALLVLIVTWRYRKLIFSILGKVERLQIGKVHFELAQTVFNEFITGESSYDIDEEENAFLQKYIAGLSDEFAWNLLKAHNQTFKLNEILDFFRKYFDFLGTFNEREATSYTYGLLIGLRPAHGVIFLLRHEISSSDDYKNNFDPNIMITFWVYPKTRELLFEKLKNASDRQYPIEE